MQPMTIETMLQVGYGCGLTSIDEAYAQVMNHYDCFFPIENFNSALSAFNLLLIDAGFTDTYEEKGKLYTRLKELTIVDAARQLGITLKEIELPQDPFKGETP